MRISVIGSAIVALVFAWLMFATQKFGVSWWVAASLTMFGGALLLFGIFGSNAAVRDYSQNAVDDPPYEEQKLVLTTDLLAPLEMRIDGNANKVSAPHAAMPTQENISIGK